MKKQRLEILDDFVSGCCEGEKCSICGKPAIKKLEETIFSDDPYPNRHPLTAYVCKEHFRMIFDNARTTTL